MSVEFIEDRSEIALTPIQRKEHHSLLTGFYLKLGLGRSKFSVNIALIVTACFFFAASIAILVISVEVNAPRGDEILKSYQKVGQVKAGVFNAH